MERKPWRASLSLKIPRIDKALGQYDFTAMTTPSLIPDAAEPFGLFDRWFAEAKTSEPSLAEAMSLATATPDGRPTLRMVLLKDVSPAGFVFYTNAQSRKGEEIAANPNAAICFHWKSLGRQVRAEGSLTQVSDAEADAYWASRPRASQIAGWASEQSRPLAARSVLEARVKEFEARFEGQPVPRPAQWTGFRLAPEVIEFWHDVPNRLHERLLFLGHDDHWHTHRLFP